MKKAEELMLKVRADVDYGNFDQDNLIDDVITVSTNRTNYVLYAENEDGEETEYAYATVIKVRRMNYYIAADMLDEGFTQALFAGVDNKPFVDFLEDKCLELWYLARLNVPEEYQRQGFGTELLRFLKNELMSYNKGMLLLQSANCEECGNVDLFYEKNGFVKVTHTSYGNSVYCRVFDLFVESEIQGAGYFEGYECIN